MMAVEDASILADFEEKEKSNPSPRKIDGDRVIYASRKLKKTRQHGRPTLCDFGQARFGSNTYSGDIQPYIYRAPEVLLQMPWNEKVDIWNVGVLVCLHLTRIHLILGQFQPVTNVPQLTSEADMDYVPKTASVLRQRFRKETF